MRLHYFEKFYSNVFSAANITDARLQNFVRLLIETLTLNNPGNIFDADILAITNGYTAYFGNYIAKGVDAAESASSTITIDDATTSFVDGTRSKYSLIESVYSKGSAIYKQFFPKGLTEFSRITRINVLSVSHRMTVKSAQYQATLGGAPFAALFAGYESVISAAITNQNQSKGNLKTTRGSVKTSRLPVETACLVGMYSVGKAFAADFVKCNTYFDFGLLYSDVPSTTMVKSGSVAGNTSIVCIDNSIVEKSIFVLKNKSDLPLQFYGTQVLNGVMVGVAIDMAAHTEKTAPFAEFGSADMLFLYVKNDTAFAGNWEVKMELAK
jgi:hypothetical protein